MSKHIKSHLNVLFADYDDNIATIFIEAIKKKYDEKYDLDFNISHQGEKVLEYAEKLPIDMFILILNNIHFSSTDVDVLERIKRAIEVAAHLKSKYKKPIIALCGHHSDSIQEMAMDAGIDFYFRLPLKLGSFLEAFEKLELK